MTEEQRKKKHEKSNFCKQKCSMLISYTIVLPLNGHKNVRRGTPSKKPAFLTNQYPINKDSPPPLINKGVRHSIA